MDDLDRQIRRHYEKQSLPSDRAQAILAAGRAAASRRRRRRVWTWLGLAAVLAISVLTWRSMSDAPTLAEKPASNQITSAMVASRVIEFFSTPGYQLAQISSDPEQLLDWLRQQGAPVVELPSALADLRSFGCQVLEVRGERVYMLCLLLDPPAPTSAAGAMPMKKGPALVHLVVAPRDRFLDPPQVGAPVRISADGTWNVATWARDQTVYVVVTMESREQLDRLVGTL